MKTLFKWILLLPVAAVVVIFALANRHPVKVSFDPFGAKLPGFMFEMPLYLVLFATLLIGVIIGGVASWFKQSKYRKAARDARADARKMQEETQRLRSQIAGLPGQKVNQVAAYTGRNAA